MQTVQLSIADPVYAGVVRDALSGACACRIEMVAIPDPSRPCVLVLDEGGFAKLALPVSNPERVVLISRKDPELLAQAWEAGIVSVVSAEDPINTVLLAIMAASLRVAKSGANKVASGFSPSSPPAAAPTAPGSRRREAKRWKIQ